jgi:hypothetical protein
LAAAEEYNDNLHEEVHLLNNQLNPLLSHDNNNDEEMGSGVIMAEDDDCNRTDQIIRAQVQKQAPKRSNF